MEDILGYWDIRIATPVGSIAATYTFEATNNGIAGTATTDSERVRLTDIIVEPAPGGSRATWRQTVTKPLRLNLTFEVTVIGDALSGHSRAGRLPRSTVQGTRLPATTEP